VSESWPESDSTREPTVGCVPCMGGRAVRRADGT
jgi:hypothetical protein